MNTGSSKRILYVLLLNFHTKVLTKLTLCVCVQGFCGRSARGPIGDATEELDSVVGEVMDVIRAPANKIDKNTLVVFTSDNGAPMRPDGNLPLRGYKTQIWEVILAFNSNSLPLPELCLHIMAFRAASASLRSPGGRARSRQAAPPKPSVRRTTCSRLC